MEKIDRVCEKHEVFLCILIPSFIVTVTIKWHKNLKPISQIDGIYSA